MEHHNNSPLLQSFSHWQSVCTGDQEPFLLAATYTKMALANKTHSCVYVYMCATWCVCVCVCTCVHASVLK